MTLLPELSGARGPVCYKHAAPTELGQARELTVAIDVALLAELGQTGETHEQIRKILAATLMGYSNGRNRVDCSSTSA